MLSKFKDDLPQASIESYTEKDWTSAVKRLPIDDTVLEMLQ